MRFSSPLSEADSQMPQITGTAAAAERLMKSICEFRDAVSKTAEKPGTYTAASVTARLISTANISLGFFRYSALNIPLCSFLHSNTNISWERLKVTIAAVRAASSPVILYANRNENMEDIPISSPLIIILKSIPPAKTLSSLFLGGTDIMSPCAGSIPRAMAGSPSVTRLISSS